MTFGVAEEANASAGNNWTYSDGRNREDECSSGKRIRSRTEWRGSS